MSLLENLLITFPENSGQNIPAQMVYPELVLLDLERLQNLLATDKLTPATYLGSEERATYRGFKYPKRQIEWLGGRLAAKQAAINLQGQSQTPAAMQKWSISADEHGKPFFKSLAANRPNLSISHSQGLAMAMAVNAKDCGLDIQKISPATVRVREKFCRPPEEQTINTIDLPDNNRATSLTLLWAAKESLRKSRGGYPLTGFLTMELTKVVQSASNFWLFTLKVKNNRYQIKTFFYKDFAIAFSVI